MTISTARGVSYVKEREISINISEGGNFITNGLGRSFYPVQIDGSIIGWRITGESSGSITVHILKSSSGNPSELDKISGSNPPKLVSQTQNSSNDLSSWSTRHVTNKDTLGVSIQGSTNLKNVVITLLVE